jgi:hypothetical protein
LLTFEAFLDQAFRSALASKTLGKPGGGHFD